MTESQMNRIEGLLWFVISISLAIDAKLTDPGIWKIFSLVLSFSAVVVALHYLSFWTKLRAKVRP